MTTKQALAELKKLARDAADNLYRRIELAAIVLEDLDWIAATYGGSDLKAQDALQGEFFPDLGGYVTLGKLIAMYRAIPKVKWAEFRFDIPAIEVLYDEQAQGEPKESGKRTAWKLIAAERLERLEEAERRIKELEATIAKLERDNAHLEGRVQQLEKMLEPAAAA